MKLICSSCDFSHPLSAEFIRSHLGIPLRDCRLLFIPNEKATPEMLAGDKYLRRMEGCGFRRENVRVFNPFDPAPYRALTIDAVYVSGGNTFGTMKRIRDSGFAQTIVDYVKNGAVYIGGSAGAHIASMDIAHVQAYDTDTHGLTDFRGLGLYHGIFVCHYTDARRDHAEMLRAGRYPVMLLRDGDAVVIKE